MAHSHHQTSTLRTFGIAGADANNHVDLFGWGLGTAESTEVYMPTWALSWEQAGHLLRMRAPRAAALRRRLLRTTAR